MSTVCSSVLASGSMRTRAPPWTDSRICAAAAMMRLAVLRRTPGISLSASGPASRTLPTVSRPASSSGANATFPRTRSRSRSTGITSRASATLRSRTASYARRAISRDSPGADSTASMASRTARPSETTARAAFPGPRDVPSMGWSSAVSGAEVLVSSAGRATVVEILRIRTGNRMDYDDSGYRRHAGNLLPWIPQSIRRLGKDVLMRYLIVAEAYRDLERLSSRLALTDRLAALLAQTPDSLLPTVCYLCQGLIAPEFAGVDLGMAEKLAVRAVAATTGVAAEQVTALVRETGDLGQAAERLLASPGTEAAALTGAL